MKNLDTRKQRMAEMLVVLKDLYPSPKPALNYSTEWELLVAVMLSAQCTDKMVNKVTETLFKKYPNFEDYLKADLSEFEQDIRQSGFYRNKAKNALASAALVKAEYGGKLPQTMDELLKLPGVARKTANVVMGALWKKSVGIAVDTHVRRFSYRFDLSDSKDPKKIEQDLMQLLPPEEWIDITLRFIDYGRDYCQARIHDCIEHPLTKIWPPAADRWIKSK
jgi:endonuclease III